MNETKVLTENGAQNKMIGDDLIIYSLNFNIHSEFKQKKIQLIENVNNFQCLSHKTKTFESIIIQTKFSSVYIISYLVRHR